MTPPDSDAANYPFSGPLEYECTGTEDGKHLFNFPCTACGASPRDLVFVGKDLAQRILAALESVDGGMDMACASLASELRAVIGK